MSRHSKHCNDRSFYSYKERADAGYGKAKREVLGSDCFLPFGYCCLSLQPPKDPVATPDGYIFDREHILEALLKQKTELNAQAKKYEEQERRKARKQEVEQQRVELKEIEAFQRADQGLISEDLRHKRALERAESKPSEDDLRPEKRLRKGEMLVLDKGKLREKSFWAKETTSNAAATELTKVDTTTRNPMSGHKLRIKDLIPVKFELLDEKANETGGCRGNVLCAVTKHPITHRKAVLLKPSGLVILESVLKDCNVLKDMKCPVTGEKLKDKDDIVKLQQAGTGFSAHNDIEAKVWVPIRSRGDDDRRNQGHLPKAGYVGLV